MHSGYCNRSVGPCVLTAVWHGAGLSRSTPYAMEPLRPTLPPTVCPPRPSRAVTSGKPRCWALVRKITALALQNPLLGTLAEEQRTQSEFLAATDFFLAWPSCEARSEIDASFRERQLSSPVEGVTQLVVCRPRNVPGGSAVRHEHLEGWLQD